MGPDDRSSFPVTDRMLREHRSWTKGGAMCSLRKSGRALTVLAMAAALCSAAAWPALAGSGHATASGPMAAFSDPNYRPAASSATAGRGAFSDLNYSPGASSATVGRGAFSDLNAFGPIPKTEPVQVAGVHTGVTTSSRAWSTDWRTIGLSTIAAILALALARVSTLYLRGRRPVI
jgi:hypothetical protein